MPLIILGLIALIVAVAVLRFTAGRDPGFVMRIARYAGIAVLVALTIFFALTERWVPAVFLAGIGWSVFTRGRAVPEGWFPRADEPAPPPPPSRNVRPQMPADEALKVLGLNSSASPEDIRAAHRRLMLQNHPDRGGSDYLASKINEAKDVLLGD
jgi:DnaJ homolog subfamily C member 19